jgi:purine nucleosidase
MEKFIIDTDPGVDDAHAIMMAVRHPNVKVEALTVVAGNVGLHNTVRNACRILDVLGADIPVYAGAALPLVYPAGDAAYVHGSDGLGDAGLPDSMRGVESEHAAVALVRMANEAPGEYTLVAIGPLTNLALALRLDPDLPSKYKKLVVMGGTIHARGNTENVSAEFNIYTDPESAHVVFESWPGLVLSSWETTVDHPIPFEIFNRWLEMDTDGARFFRSISKPIMKLIREVMNREAMFAADGVAMAAALEPDIIKHAERHHVSVETNGRYTRGQTTVDWFDRSGKTANTEVVMELDNERLFELLEMALS